MPNKATVTDVGLGAAFKEGVNEGFRLTGYVTVFFKIGGQTKAKYTVEAHEVPKVVGEFLESLRGEHYEVGIKIKILADGDVGPGQASAPSGAAGVDGLPVGEDTTITDAEVVEDQVE